ncbi:hypothetical protein [Streptomyces albus]|uniref:hypothetical protein n=1 Tax=Streptomyces TaxID=1883 RepID=UPI000B12CC0C|nr:hypothetical protein [Streptomyces albus]QID37498.1 hypothetical protein G3260_003947 [Streptomyces albus]
MTALTPSRDDWAGALASLYGRSRVLVSAGPRTSEDWAHDVNAVLNRSVGDPRGWPTVDRIGSESTPRGRGDRSPFHPCEDDVLRGCLEPTDRATGRLILLSLAAQFGNVGDIAKGSAHRQVLHGATGTLLARFGDDATYWTCVEDFEGDCTPDDFYVNEWYGLTDLARDFGLVVASEDEVGVFWFGADD